jgi:hypothetical protein
VRTYNSADDWFLVLPVAADGTRRSNGDHYMYYDRDGTIPFPSFSWTNIGSFVEESHRPALAAVPAYSRIYLWYVR